MRLELTGRHIDITPSLRRIVDAKLAKLERLLNDSAVSAQVVLTREKFRRGAEITLHARGENFLHGVGSSETWERSLTQAVDKIAHQAEKVKGKWQERKRGGVRRAPRGGRTARRLRRSRGPSGAADAEDFSLLASGHPVDVGRRRRAGDRPPRRPGDLPRSGAHVGQRPVSPGEW